MAKPAVKPAMSTAYRKPFQAQADYLRRKLAIPSERWDDLIQDQHDAGFIVAGAMKAELIQDLKTAVQKAIENGTSIQQFRQDFNALVVKRGWTGWTGEGSKQGHAWRTRMIYATNLRTSFAAGRYQQMNDPDVLAYYPYVMFQQRSTESPRAEHAKWHGLVLPHDDPFVLSHPTPMGFGCKCQWIPVSERDLQRMGKKRPDKSPPIKMQQHINKQTGEVYELPQGIQAGWGHQAGKRAWEMQKAASRAVKAGTSQAAQYASNQRLANNATAHALALRKERLEQLEHEIARLNVKSLVDAPLFARMFSRAAHKVPTNSSSKSKIRGSDWEFPIAVLHPKDKQRLGAQASVVMLSEESLRDHLIKHPDIGLKDYRNIQQILDKGEVYHDPKTDERLIYFMQNGKRYRAVLKRTRDGGKNYFLTLFRDEQNTIPKRGYRIR